MARRPKSRFLVLGLLSGGPKSGYDIKTEVEDAASHFWKESFSSIYPVLDQLHREGLIEQSEDGDEDARGRRVYSLTRQGRAALTRWLDEPPEPDVVRNELLLKLYVGGDAPPDVLAAHVAGYRAQQERIGRILREAERELTTSTAVGDRREVYRLLTVRLGRRVNAARIKWADETLGTLATIAPPARLARKRRRTTP